MTYLKLPAIVNTEDQHSALFEINEDQHLTVIEISKDQHSLANENEKAKDQHLLSIEITEASIYLQLR